MPILVYLSNFGMGGGEIAAQVVEPLSGGKGDNDGRRRKKLHLPFKPTGLIDRPSRRNIERRVAEAREVAAEVSAKLAKEFTQEPAQASPIELVSLSAIDREIGVLLREETQQQDMEVILNLLTACVAAGAI